MKEHINSVVMAGPISKFKVGNATEWGTNISFLVGGGNEIPLRVSMMTKFQDMIDKGQTAKSVVLTNAYMDMWVGKKDVTRNFQVSARPAGVFFLENMVDSYCLAQVEGEITAVNGEWLMLESSYKVPGKKGEQDSGPKWKSRPVNAKLATAISPQVVGQTALVIGRPIAKFGDSWFLHIAAEKAYILYGARS